MKRLRLMPVLVGLLMCASHAFAALSELGVENRIIVAFKLGTSAAEQKQIVTAQGLAILDGIPSLAVLLVEAPSGLSAQARTRLSAHPKVFRADPDVWVKWIESASASVGQTPFAVEPAVAAMKALAKSAPVQRCRGAESAAEIPGRGPRRAPGRGSATGSGVKVAVIDTVSSQPSRPGGRRGQRWIRRRLGPTTIPTVRTWPEPSPPR